MKEQFIQAINEGYSFKGESLILGGAMLEGQALPGVQIKVPFRTLNRHGLIAGATGTGKTKSLQVLAEQLSAHSVPVLLMDVKGDLSGIAAAGESKPKIIERCEMIGIDYKPDAFPVELLSLSHEPGARLRATVTEFGPVLFSKLLELSDTQSGVVSVIFKYCDDHNLPLIDLKDFKKVMQYLTNEGKAEIEQEYGRLSTASTGAILRKVVELEQQGAETFFGERSFDVNDLIRVDEKGRGMVSIIRLTDIQDRPKMFSTFMLSLLAEVYSTFPEEGDLEAPKLCIFIDEAHLIFSQASSALLDQIESIIRLIRSKGVGVFFITQSPADIPNKVLGQLGLKIQHSLRAFTAVDRKAIKLAAENFPITTFYDVDERLTNMGIGEALVTVLNEKGIPTPLAHTLMRPPLTRMDILSPGEIDELVRRSALVRKYNQEIDSVSAHEILSEKIAEAQEDAHKEAMARQHEQAGSGGRTRQEPTLMEELSKNTMVRQVGRTLAREVARGLLGVLGLGGSSRRRR